MKIKKGDQVKILSGKDRGKKGKIVKVLRKTGKVIVSGINIVKKHQKSRGQDKPGGIKEMEAPLYASKVMVIDPKSEKTTRIGYVVEKGKKKQRIAKKSNSNI